MEIADGTAQIQKIVIAREFFGRDFVPYQRSQPMTGHRGSEHRSPCTRGRSCPASGGSPSTAPQATQRSVPCPAPGIWSLRWTRPTMDRNVRVVIIRRQWEGVLGRRRLERALPGMRHPMSARSRPLGRDRGGPGAGASPPSRDGRSPVDSCSRTAVTSSSRQRTRGSAIPTPCWEWCRPVVRLSECRDVSAHSWPGS